MSRQGKPPIDFEVNHEGELFPSQDDKEAFGFEPLEVFLVDDVDSDDVIEPRIIFYGEAKTDQESGEEISPGEDLINNIEDDLLLASRYIRDDFDIDNSFSIPWGLKNYPRVQREFNRASIDVSDDFIGFVQLIDDTLEGTDSELMYRIDLRDKGKVKRFKDVEEYTDFVSGGHVTAWPEIFGLNSVDFYPQSFKAVISLYQQEVTAPRNTGSDRYGITDEENWETINLNYDEEPIEELEESLQTQGLSTERDYFPPSVVPDEIQ